MKTEDLNGAIDRQHDLEILCGEIACTGHFGGIVCGEDGERK